MKWIKDFKDGAANRQEYKRKTTKKMSGCKVWWGRRGYLEKGEIAMDDLLW